MTDWKRIFWQKISETLIYLSVFQLVLDSSALRKFKYFFRHKKVTKKLKKFEKLHSVVDIFLRLFYFISFKQLLVSPLPDLSFGGKGTLEMLKSSYKNLATY